MILQGATAATRDIGVTRNILYIGI